MLKLLEGGQAERLRQQSCYPVNVRPRLITRNAIAYLIALTSAGYAIQHSSMNYEKFEPVVWLIVAPISVAVLVPLSHRINKIARGVVIVVVEGTVLLLFTMYIGRLSGVHLHRLLSLGLIAFASCF